ncbi:MAG: hypothetical protein QM784_22020 [Polyangiaceae bacterium]
MAIRSNQPQGALDARKPIDLDREPHQHGEHLHVEATLLDELPRSSSKPQLAPIGALHRPYDTRSAEARVAGQANRDVG